MTPFEKAAAIERDRQWNVLAPEDDHWSDQRKADALTMCSYDRRGLLNELGWRAFGAASDTRRDPAFDGIAEAVADLDVLARSLATHTMFALPSWAAVLRQIEAEGYKVVLAEAAPGLRKVLDVERLARAMHLAQRLPEMEEPYCDNPLTDADLRDHMAWAEAILHAYALLPPYGDLRGAAQVVKRQSA